LYGLKQSPAEWADVIKNHLLEFGFTRSLSDAGLYVWDRDGIYCVLCLYVDDMFGGCSDQAFIERLYSSLQGQFEMTRKSKLDYVLGMEVDSDADGNMLVHQNKYIHDVLSRHKIVRKRSLPMAPDFVAKSDEGEVDPLRRQQYQTVVGALLWISRCTRPDISTAVGILCRYMHNPSQRHMDAAHGVLEYLNNTTHYKLRFTRYDRESSQSTLSPKVKHIYTRESSLLAYSDSDYAGDLDTRHSTSGMITFFGHCPISWSSTKQNLVSTSTTEAEYVALSSMAKEIIYLQQVCESASFKQNKTRIYADNQAANFISKNAKTSARTKHFDVRLHHIRELSERQQILITDIETKENVADLFTKPVTIVVLRHLISKFMQTTK
jgi:hypothetical protein